MVRIDRPSSPTVSAPEARPRKVELEKAARQPAAARKPISSAGDTVTISNRPPARSPQPSSATPLGNGVNTPDVKK